ncbi:hypothetical protein SERLA73DRAFT_184964 [Serpula lacrymans var. lacrymans S7.3]|uniref:DUF6534 domain-containing protein n=2 Tax=Serpula lacrymans var. lacrymans TaxID=341189 RepID=F8Q3U6_SERL3|nr:uncharacterized protein SERLADRAFT_473159 [Serpula lacrymans var. lacrymans S7.9]EGN96802.1 hypothetical protein SERLA73DRAFT_184964 [Serpula lacrymans var. lacrymans S7.3]EGO22401.1 hypothetical protein SERLADRAFT_473159 [Serpula lacrymans var. lacrymans S7.9]
MAPSPVIAIMQGGLCGTLATMFMYGIICMQAFFYIQNYASDKKRLKILVASIWCLETVHTALSIHFVEHYLILNFYNPEALEYVVWSMSVTYIVGFVIAFSVNLCFIWRIWLLGKSLWISSCLVILATIRFGFGVGNCSMSLRYTLWAVFRDRVYPTMVAGWVLSVLADSAIACALCCYLHAHRTGIRRTDSIINRLLLYTINTGAITSFFAVLVIIMFLAIPDTQAFVAFVQVQSKLYAVSLLASLNSRKSTLQKAQMAIPTDVSLAFLPTTSKSAPLSPFEKQTRRIEIHQSTDVYNHQDDP